MEKKMHEITLVLDTFGWNWSFNVTEIPKKKSMWLLIPSICAELIKVFI